MSEKKKVGVVTLNGYYNYGNRLQNYAVEYILKEMGCEVETIVKINKNDHKKGFFDKLGKIKNKSLDEIIDFVKKKINKKIYNYKYYDVIQKKNQKFKQFSEQFLTEKKYKIDENLDKEFDYFVAGSDQVWNPTNQYPSFEFLDFTSNSKKIAFSPSFGVSEIPDSHKTNYRNWLDDFSFLSIREEAGAKIIKELTGRDAKVLVDPTMLLTNNHWKSIIEEDDFKPNNKYLLTYIIGDRLKKWNDQIYQIADDEDLEIVNLADVHDKKRFVAGPSEYLDYFSSAEVIFTDSFHGTIFSILFNKPFVVFERTSSCNMISRLETLLNIFNFKNRFFDNLEYEDILNINFLEVNEILYKERKKATKYLKNALMRN